MEMQRQFEIKRRELVDLESNIRAKEAELERLKDHAFSREVKYANDPLWDTISIIFSFHLEICRSFYENNERFTTKIKK